MNNLGIDEKKAKEMCDYWCAWVKEHPDMEDKEEKE